MLHGAFWDADLVDRVQIFVAPRTIGEAGVAVVGGVVMSSTADCMAKSRGSLGDDVLMEGHVHRAD